MTEFFTAPGPLSIVILGIRDHIRGAMVTDRAVALRAGSVAHSTHSKEVQRLA